LYAQLYTIVAVDGEKCLELVADSDEIGLGIGMIGREKVVDELPGKLRH
jgi:hypothetical protein